MSARSSAGATASSASTGTWNSPMYQLRAAWALCGSKHDAEDLVQETFLNVLKRPRLLREGNELGYLMRALRNTYASRYRRAAHRRPVGGILAGDH